MINWKLPTAALAVSLAFAAPQAAIAQDEYPLKGAEWIEVTGVSLKDGAGLKYATWLAGQWRQRMDYAVSQGWVQSYEIWSNTYSRKGESDLYLVTRFGEFEDDDEWERRNRQMRQYMQRSISQLNQESADRAEYRTVESEMLLKRLVWRN